MDNVILVLNLFYSLQRGSNGFTTEKTILFQGSKGGPLFTRGVQLFPGRGPTFPGGGGGPNANFYKTHITCDFSRGGGGGHA